MAIGEINPKVAARLREYETPILREQRPTERTSAGLRNALFDEIDALRRGTGDPKRALAIAKLAQNILDTARMEYKSGKDGLPSRPVPLVLGDETPQD